MHDESGLVRKLAKQGTTEAMQPNNADGTGGRMTRKGKERVMEKDGNAAEWEAAQPYSVVVNAKGAAGPKVRKNNQEFDERVQGQPIMAAHRMTRKSHMEVGMPIIVDEDEDAEVHRSLTHGHMTYEAPLSM